MSVSEYMNRDWKQRVNVSRDGGSWNGRGVDE